MGRKTCQKCLSEYVCEIYRDVDATCYKFYTTLSRDTMIFISEPLAEHCSQYKTLDYTQDSDCLKCKKLITVISENVQHCEPDDNGLVKDYNSCPFYEVEDG